MTTYSEALRLHRCQAAKPVAFGTKVPRLPWRTIDVHCHVLVPELEKLVASYPTRVAEAEREAEATGAASREVNAQQVGALLPKFLSVEERMRDMDNMGVDIQVLSPSPTQYHYWAEPDLADIVITTLNDHIASLCEAHPDRFRGFGTVALQRPDRAAEQLEELIRGRGFRGVEISTLVNGRDVADRFFDPFWSKADELGAVVFIHPWGTSLGTRLSQYYLMNTIGQPLETAICLSKLIFGGTLDRHPGVRIVAAHGGGYFPAYCGRSDHSYAVRPEAGGCACHPSDYLKRMWFDTVVYDPEQLRSLVERVGADRVVTGSDYPFDMGEYNPSGLIADLPAETQRMILGENAEKLLNI